LSGEKSEPRMTFYQLQKLCNGGGSVGVFQQGGKYGFTIQVTDDVVIFQGAAVYATAEAARATGDEAMASIRGVSPGLIQRLVRGRAASWLVAVPLSPTLTTKMHSLDVWPWVEKFILRK
jgi:hypothetical protein